MVMPDVVTYIHYYDLVQLHIIEMHSNIHITLAKNPEQNDAKRLDCTKQMVTPEVVTYIHH